MEAAVADREAEMTEWNDGRLDELSKRVNELGVRMEAGFARVDDKFDLVYGRLDSLQQTLIRIAWTFGIGMLGLVGVLIGIIATKL